jgi:hypothetical protein
MGKLSSNRELYDYLLRLMADLERRGARALVDALAVAKGHAAMSTEFLGETRMALRRVLKEENGILEQPERAELVDVLKQLDDLHDQRGNRAR